MDRINRSPESSTKIGTRIVHGALRFSPLYHVDFYEAPHTIPIQLSYPDRQCQREVFSNGGSIYRGVIFCIRAVCSFMRITKDRNIEIY